MISYSEITKRFSIDLKGKRCIEIEFMVNGSSRYELSCMGKMPDSANKENSVFWYGLVPDGSEAYDYDNFQDFATAPVFEGKSLEEIWHNVVILSIDGCDPEERIEVYL